MASPPQPPAPPEAKTESKQPLTALEKRLAPLGMFLKGRTTAIERIIPGGMLKVEEVISATLMAARKNDAILRCNMESVLIAVMDVVALGLCPHWGARGEAALVPFGDTLTPIIGYKGYAKLFWRHKLTAGLAMNTRHEGDVWKLLETENGPRMRFAMSDGDRTDANLLGAWARIVFTRGGSQIVYVPRAKIDKIRDGVLAKIKSEEKKHLSPWVAWYPEQAMKTAMRQLAKLAPVERDLETALEVDDAGARARGEYVESPGWTSAEERLLEQARPVERIETELRAREAVPVRPEKITEVPGYREETSSFPASNEGAKEEVVDARSQPSSGAPPTKGSAQRENPESTKPYDEEAGDPEREAIQAEARQADLLQQIKGPATSGHPPPGTSEYARWWFDQVSSATTRAQLDRLSGLPTEAMPLEERKHMGPAYTAKSAEIRKAKK